MQISSGNEFNASDNICNCNKDMRAVKRYHVCVRATCRAVPVLPRTPAHTRFFSNVIIVLVKEVADTNGK